MNLEKLAARLEGLAAQMAQLAKDLRTTTSSEDPVARVQAAIGLGEKITPELVAPLFSCSAEGVVRHAVRRQGVQFIGQPVRLANVPGKPVGVMVFGYHMPLQALRAALGWQAPAPTSFVASDEPGALL